MCQPKTRESEREPRLGLWKGRKDRSSALWKLHPKGLRPRLQTSSICRAARSQSDPSLRSPPHRDPASRGGAARAGRGFDPECRAWIRGLARPGRAKEIGLSSRTQAETEPVFRGKAMFHADIQRSRRRRTSGRTSRRSLRFFGERTAGSLPALGDPSDSQRYPRTCCASFPQFHPLFHKYPQHGLFQTFLCRPGSTRPPPSSIVDC